MGRQPGEQRMQKSPRSIMFIELHQHKRGHQEARVSLAKVPNTVPEVSLILNRCSSPLNLRTHSSVTIPLRRVNQHIRTVQSLRSWSHSSNTVPFWVCSWNHWWAGKTWIQIDLGATLIRIWKWLHSTLSTSTPKASLYQKVKMYSISHA